MSATPNIQADSLTALIDHIVSHHHAFLRRELPRIDTLLAGALAADRQQHGATLTPLSGVFHGLRAELESHMMKEEMILFPHVRELEQALGAGQAPTRPPFGSFTAPISVMEAEHENATAALARMREITGGYQAPAGGSAAYQELVEALSALEQDLHTHIHLENNILFPRAIELEGRAG